MALSAWVRFFDPIEADLRARILARLEQAEVAVQDVGDPCGAGIVVIDRLSATLLDFLRAAAKGSSVLVLSVACSPLGSAQSWPLIQSGALDVLHWPAVPPRADDVACRLDRWRAVQDLATSALVTGALVGASPPWRRLVAEVIEAAVFSRASVLITGESGTGKELIARLIHDLDPRPDKGEFVVVDCTTISPELSGSEFFGHERGAFTGAQNAREGAFAVANGGTLFLDEVGELSPPLQAQLLRVVQEHKFKRLGSNLWHSTEFRLICATNRNLGQGIIDGSFRADLFYRIAAWQCRTVALRERKEDVLPLVRHFIAELRPELAGVELDGAVREFFLTQDYPGNVRELRQQVTRIVSRHAGAGPITIGDIAPGDRGEVQLENTAWPDDGFAAAVRIAVERGVGMKEISQAAADLAVALAIEREGGNLQRAAVRLGVTDRALQMRRAQPRAAS